jgi:AcrR family transcriptional regulator
LDQQTRQAAVGPESTQTCSHLTPSPVGLGVGVAAGAAVPTAAVAVPTSPAATPTSLSRGQILDATARCLKESGYDGTTIRRIAGKLDCAVGSIYRYFKDKRELLFAVTQRRFEPVASLVEGGSPFEQSAALYLQRAGDDAECYHLMFWLACVGQDTPVDARAGHETANAPAPRQVGRPQAELPPIIARIVTGWSKQIGDGRRALAAWSILHGSAVLGRDPASALQDTLRLIAPVQPGATEPTIASSPRASDDLTLL